MFQHLLVIYLKAVLMTKESFFPDAVPLYDGVALMRSLQNTKAYLGMDPTVHLECFPNRR